MRPDKKSQPSAMEVHQALKDFALSPEKEIELQTTQELEVFLAENAVSIEPSTEDIKDRLEAARNRVALTIAREERLRSQKVSPLTQVVKATLLTGKSLRDEVSRRLSSLNPQTSAMFARDFQEGDDDDLRAMLSALDRLESNENSGGDDDV